MNYPGWEDSQDWEEKYRDTENNLFAVHQMRSLLNDLRNLSPEEKQFIKTIKQNLDKLNFVMEAQMEIYGGCYGADIWEEDLDSGKSRKILSEVIWPDVEDHVRHLTRQGGGHKVYWVRPHNPCANQGFLSWIKNVINIFRTYNKDKYPWNDTYGVA